MHPLHLPWGLQQTSRMHWVIWCQSLVKSSHKIHSLMKSCPSCYRLQYHQEVSGYSIENHPPCVKWTKIWTRQQDRLLIKVTHPVLLGQETLSWRPITIAINLTCPKWASNWSWGQATFDMLTPPPPVIRYQRLVKSSHKIHSLMKSCPSCYRLPSHQEVSGYSHWKPCTPCICHGGCSRLPECIGWSDVRAWQRVLTRSTV